MDEQICINNCQRLQEISDEVARETAANREIHESFKRRINDLEESSKKQSEILVTLQKQADAIDTMNHKIDDVGNKVSKIVNRVDDIERAPGENWKKITFEVIKYIVIAAVGAGLMYAFGIG